MNRAVPLFLILALMPLVAEEKAAVQLKEDDIKELEALKKQSNDSAPKPIVVGEGVTITPLTSDIQELEALKKQTAGEMKEADVTPPKLDKTYSGQIVQGDEDGSGVELFLYNDGSTVPILFLIQATGHEVGAKLTVSGVFEGAMKFEGAYYPVLKVNKPETEPVAPTEKSAVTPEPSLGEDSNHPHLNGFQLSNILFVIFITASLAIVGLRLSLIHI
jgi:hypothetical protein